jgi:hypothetical protein
LYRIEQITSNKFTIKSLFWFGLPDELHGCMRPCSLEYMRLLETSDTYTVRKTASLITDGAYFNVNVPAKTCSCHHWQQSGVPRAHAYKAIAPVASGITFDEKYYYEFCLSTRLLDMFKVYDAMTVLNMQDVKTLVSVRESENKAYPRLCPRTVMLLREGRSNKRNHSTGDTAAGGGLSQSAVAKLKKSGCPGCGKKLSVKNKKHAYSKSCVKCAKRKSPVPCMR